MATLDDVSTKLHDCEGLCVATFKALCEEAGYTLFRLAVDADVSLSTLNRMNGTAKGTVTARTANNVLRVLGQKLGRKITIDDVHGLRERVK